MDGVKSVVLGLCVGCLGAGVWGLFAPSGGLSKMMKSMLGVFLLTVLLTSVGLVGKLSGEFSFAPEPLQPSENLWQEHTTTAESYAKEQVELIALQAGKAHDVTVKVLSVEIDASCQPAEIIQVFVLVEGTQAQAQAVKQTMLQNIGAPVALQWTKE